MGSTDHALLMWGSLAVFGAIAAGKAVLALRAAPGLRAGLLGSAVAGFLVLGASLMALRDPERFAPSPPWLAYVTAGGTVVYVATLL